MPQEIKIVKCFKCSTFQTQISKKAKQWTCVVCGEKQSLKRSYGTGNGKECRLQVQKLNEMRGTAEEMEVEEEFDRPEEHQTAFEAGDFQNEPGDEPEPGDSETALSHVRKDSKWLKYLDDPPGEVS